VTFSLPRILLIALSLGSINSNAFAQTSATPDTQVQPAPATALPPTVATVPVVTQSQPAGFYYYCEREKTYYPTITHCAEGWIAIPVGAPPPVAEHHWQTPTQPATEDDVRSRPNVVSIELFGRALVYSLNYDRAVSEQLTLGLGVTSWHVSNRWQDYSSTVTVVPFYGNYYFTQNAGRGFISAGFDLISSSDSGDHNGTFTNSGVAGVFGGGYEYRDKAGFLIRLGGFLIIGRSVDISPSLSLGYAF